MTPCHRLRNSTAVYAVCVGLAVLTVLCVAVALWTGHRRTMLILASSAFVLIAFVGAIARPSRYGWFALAGLTFCWLGDFFGPRDFTLGAVMFLIGHLAFIAAFWSHGADLKRCLYTLGAFLLVSIAVLYWLFSAVPGNNQLIVFSYMAVITTMVVSAGGTRAGNGRLLILFGAVIFYVSDIFVARWRFVSPGAINAFFCYPLYYTACILLAFSVLAHGKGIIDSES